MSWRAATSTLEVFPLTYERLFSNVRQTLAEILAFYRLTVSGQQMTAAIRAMLTSDTRFNKGVSGRGVRLLSSQHKLAIHQLAAVWHIDLAEMRHRPAPGRLSGGGTG